MSAFYKRIFAAIITGCLVLIMSLGTFTSGAGVMMTLRDYDASIGLISRPKESFDKMGSAYRKLFPEIKVEAQCFSMGVPCATEVGQQTRWSLDQALNKLLRQLVMAFVQAFLNFLLQQFQKLLDIISQWAETLFGVKLNTCQIMRYVAIQAYTLQNKIETSVGDFADGIFGPLKDTAFIGGASTATRLKTAQSIGKVSSTVADAVAAAETRKAIETADQNYPQCAGNKPVGGATANQQRQQLAQTVNAVAESFCKSVEEIVGSGTGGQDSITAAGLTIGRPILGPQCLDAKALVSDVNQKLNERSQKTAENAQKAIQEQQKASPPNCSGIVLMEQNQTTSEVQKALTAPGGVLPSFASLRQDKIELYEKNTLTSGDLNTLLTTNTAFTDLLGEYSETNTTRGVDQNECALGDKVKAGYEAVSNAKTDGGAGDEGTLLDAILSTIQDFVKAIIDSLINMITSIIINVIQKVFAALSGIGGGIFANAFTEFSNGLQGEVFRVSNDLKTAVGKTIDEAFPARN
jgi:hypothetical protein